MISGGAAYAGSHLANNSVRSKQLKKNADRYADQCIDAGDRATAQTANSLSPPEALQHPALLNAWKNPPPSGIFSLFEPVALYKDHEGLVHLSGVALFGESAKPVFQMPPGYRPASGKRLALATSCSCGTLGTGVLGINGPNVPGQLEGAVIPPEGTIVSLDGVTFRAES